MSWQLAVLGIESTTLTVVVDLLIICAAVVYLALIYWTFQDARRRIEDPTLISCATLVSLVPFVGTLVYVIVRPAETLEDAQERELELEATKLRLYELESALCPHCDYPIERDFVRCPSCLRKLKERCKSCSRPLDRAWTICPYCETEVAPAARSGGRRGRGASTPATAAGRGSRPPAPERGGEKASPAPAGEGSRRESQAREGVGAKEVRPVAEGAQLRGERGSDEHPPRERPGAPGSIDLGEGDRTNGSVREGPASTRTERTERAAPARSGRATES